MLLDLKPLFAGTIESLPIDFSIDLSEVDFYGIKPLKKPVLIKGNIESRAGIVEAKLTWSSIRLLVTDAEKKQILFILLILFAL